MAITDENTVLILGAGVSVPFGLPTGANLIDDIAKNLSVQITSFSKETGHGFSPNRLYPTNTYESFLRFPYLQPLLWKIKSIRSDGNLSIEPQQLRQELHAQFLVMQELRELLQNQTSDSIDDFIVMNPSYSDHAKICIAAEFIKALYEAKPNEGNTLRNIDSRKLHWQIKDYEDKSKKLEDRNWIHRLINLIRLGVSEGKVTKENKVQIITFNYDTILEHVLEQQFSNTESGREKGHHWEDFVEITHVHGQCGELVQKLNMPGKTCWEWSQGIKVIRESEEHVGSDIKKARDHARNLIKNAKEIYSCGFAFAKANTDLLGLEPGAAKNFDGHRKINYNNFTDDIGLKNAAEKFHYKAKNGTVYSEVVAQSKMGVADWIGIGTLGELP